MQELQQLEYKGRRRDLLSEKENKYIKLIGHNSMSVYVFHPGSDVDCRILCSLSRKTCFFKVYICKLFSLS